jgi:hypothetical protein
MTGAESLGLEPIVVTGGPPRHSAIVTADPDIRWCHPQ